MERLVPMLFSHREDSTPALVLARACQLGLFFLHMFSIFFHNYYTLFNWIYPSRMSKYHSLWHLWDIWGGLLSGGEGAITISPNESLQIHGIVFNKKVKYFQPFKCPSRLTIVIHLWAVQTLRLKRILQEDL